MIMLSERNQTKKYIPQRQNMETKIRAMISRAGTGGGERIDRKSQKKAFWGDRKVLCLLVVVFTQL